MLAEQNNRSKRYAYLQYDSTVQANTIFGPGQAAAAVVRVEGTSKALAITTLGRMAIIGKSNRAEAVRLAIERCGYRFQRPCVILAVGNSLTMQIPKSRIVNPMYNSIVKLYPNPNNVPGLVTQEFINNYLASAMPKNENFNSIVNRYDYALGDKHRFNARWQWNDRLADEYDRFADA